LVLIVLALLRVNAPPESQPTKGTTAQAPTTGEAAAPSLLSSPGALGPLYEHLRIRAPHPRGAEPQSLEQLLRHHHVEVMIATLPDPRRTRVAPMFDMMLEAIRRAIDSDNYVLDRFFLPWLGSDATTHIGGHLTWKNLRDVSVDLRSGADRAGRASEPGSILFRPVLADELQPQKPLRLLLIVGETPTFGVDKLALWTALEIAGQLGPRPESPNRPLKIIGPTFSGSAESLARTLKEWRQNQHASDSGAKPAEVWVCTGSATNVEKNEFEELAGPGVRFSATVIPDDFLFGEMVEWLQARNPRVGHKPGEETIALLAEAGTGYSTWARVRKQPNWLTIPFPLHISQMRGSSVGRQRDPIVAQQRGHVAIPIDELPEADDQIPSLTPKMTTASDSLILSNILATIAREEVRYVGIVATDVLDVLFLAGLIREKSPDVQVVLVGADLRYVDPEFTFDFRGAIVASSYPLDGLQQNWTYPGLGQHRRLVFVSDADIGSYNATLVLLHAEPAPDSQLTIPAERARAFLAYGEPRFGTEPSPDETRPAIWINQVGQEKLWPLKAIPLEQRKGTPGLQRLIPAIDIGKPIAAAGSAPETRDRAVLNLPMFFKLAAMASSAIGILLGLMWLFMPPGGADLPGRLLRCWLQARGDTSETASPGTSQRTIVRGWIQRSDAASEGARWCVFLIAASIAVPCSLMLRAGMILVRAKVLSDHFWDEFAHGIILILLGLNILVLLGVILGTLRPRLSSNRNEDAATPGRGSQNQFARAMEQVRPVLQVLIAVLIVVLVISGIFPWVSGNEPVLFALRDVHLESGVSPIVSVLALGAEFFSLGFLGLAWLDLEDRLRKPKRSVVSDGLDRAGPWGQALKKALQDSDPSVLLGDPLAIAATSWVGIALAGIVLAFFAVTLFEIGHRSVSTLEYPWLDVAFAVTFILNLALLAWLLARFVFLWRRLSAVFRQIAQLPLGAAVARLPERLRLLFGRFVRTDSDIDAGWEIFEHAAKNLPAARAEADGLIHRLEAALPELVNSWQALSVARAFGSEGEQPAASAWDTAWETADGQGRMHLVEDALAIFLIQRLRPYALALRWLAYELTIGPILLLVAATCFVFEPQQFTATLLWAFIVLALMTIVVVYVCVDRDAFVSLVSKTKPNEVTKDWTFSSTLLTHLAPALTAFLIAFPGIWYWLRSALGPLSSALK
jgi:hypothetical protein